MKQYLVITKRKAYLIEAETFGTFEITDGRRTIYKFFKKDKNGVDLVAVFDAKEVKAVIEQ